jgi:hypothetical protein
LSKVPEVQPKSFAEARFVYKATYVGTAKIVAKFTSEEMDDVDGFRFAFFMIEFNF